MRYFSLFLRILIFVIWFKLLHFSGYKPETAEFCSGIWFILVSLFLSMQAVMWPKAMLCPFFGWLRSGCSKK